LELEAEEEIQDDAEGLDSSSEDEHEEDENYE
jgi:hypothetical protein